MLHLPGDLAQAFPANYPEFPDSCLPAQFSLLKDVHQVLVDRPHVLLEQLCHQRLGQPHGFVFKPALVAAVGHFVFRGEAMDRPLLLCLLGALFSVAGQFGDLLFSSIKRDLGIKDLGVVLPGHGGLLDRFDSLILVSPIVFHLVNYVQGVGLGERSNLITGSFGNP